MMNKLNLIVPLRESVHMARPKNFALSEAAPTIIIVVKGWLEGRGMPSTPTYWGFLSRDFSA